MNKENFCIKFIQNKRAQIILIIIGYFMIITSLLLISDCIRVIDEYLHSSLNLKTPQTTRIAILLFRIDNLKLAIYVICFAVLLIFIYKKVLKFEQKLSSFLIILFFSQSFLILLFSFIINALIAPFHLSLGWISQ
jgi:hypothetical protein